MKISSPKRKRKAGYISVVYVLSTGAILSILSIYAYKRALASQEVQVQVQMRLDYSEKEEAILRSIVAITPNRAIRAMQSGSFANAASREPLRWENIFSESLALANARTSISPEMIDSLDIPGLRLGNIGDYGNGPENPNQIFRSILPGQGFVSEGLNQQLGRGYPGPLVSTDGTTIERDRTYPIISRRKTHGALTAPSLSPTTPVSLYPEYNLWRYPDISFGYARPGELFVAKRNWWAFSVDVADNDDDRTRLARNKRDFVLSIYEIPSQLSISSSSFMSLGQFSNGEAWQNVTIDGGVFAGHAETVGTTNIESLATRRGMTLSGGTRVGGQTFAGDPFTPGLREAATTRGTFFPVSLASESGRAAFVPINRGPDFFDRLAQPDDTNMVSTTGWNDYTIGARQCKMRLDIVSVVNGSQVGSAPTALRFSYMTGDGTREDQRREYIAPLAGVHRNLPAGYVQVAAENETVVFDSPVDVAYGYPGGYVFMYGVTGSVRFDNATFGDSFYGQVKSGYVRRAGGVNVRQAFEIDTVRGQTCVAVYPQRLGAFLRSIDATAAGLDVNNSLAVNVDYGVQGINNPIFRPSIPCTDSDYGMILEECSNLTEFTRGFSIVTNLRMFVGDDFNSTAMAPPAGYTPRVTASNPTGRFLPPCSIFTPELRYGTKADPFAVSVGGQIGSLSRSDRTEEVETEVPVVRPLDSRNREGQLLSSDRVTVNLSQIRHPAEIPPICMMNWLILLEERRREFY